MLNFLFKLVLTITLFSTLNGCATFNKTSQEPPMFRSWQARQNELTALKFWHINAAIAVKYQNNNEIAYLDWQQNDKNYSIDIAGPFGLNAIRIIGDEQKVTLWRNNKIVTTAKTPDQLFKNELVYDFPISNLKYWIKALPAPGITGQINLDEFNQLHTLVEQDWQISYDQFETVNGISLPTKIWLIYDKAPLNIKMAIKKWQIG